MGPPSYMRSVVDRNVVMRRIPVFYQIPLGSSRCNVTARVDGSQSGYWYTKLQTTEATTDVGQIK
jgi:hypothetical protein